MRNPKFSRVDAQIDPHGAIRGQYNGGGSKVCIITFVWKKE